jgi:putative tryptophan/tyrosine transport system substrate-binding protein
MTRREFITLLGGAAAAWPLAAPAQQPAVPVIGFLRTTSRADAAHLAAAFRQGLKEAGFVDGQNIAIEHRYAENQPGRLPALVADLISRQVDLLVASGGDVAPRAAKSATSTVPILFAMGGDPVAAGLVASLSRPGGNVTGVVFFSGALGMKRLELLRELVPSAKTIGLLVTPNSPETDMERRDIEAAAQSTGRELVVLDATSEQEIVTAFSTFVQRGAGALLVGSGPFFNSNRERLVALAASHALPASYSLREYAVAGGLMTYGASITDAYRQLGTYAGRMLKGARPADLPVVRATKLELVINLKTAKALGLEVPPTLLARADEVIE